MKNNFLSFFLSTLLHAFVAVSVILCGINFGNKKTILEEVPMCTIPLEIKAISEVSQAPISKPKVLDPQMNEKNHDDDYKIIENILPEDKPVPVEKEPAITIDNSDDELAKIIPEKPAPPVLPEKNPTITKDNSDDELAKIIPEKPEPPVLPEKKPAVTKDNKVVAAKITPPKPKKKKLSMDEVMEKAISSKKLKTTKKKSHEDEDFIKVLNDIDKKRPKGSSAETPVTDPNSTSKYGAARVGSLSMSTIDRVRKMLEHAWRVPLRANEGGDLVVVVRLHMNHDGTVNHTEVIDNQGTTKHPAYKVAVENALRAVSKFYNVPLPFPHELYEQWKIFDFNFNTQ